MNARRFLGRARLVLYGSLGLFAIYVVLRFDVVVLSEDGTSPLAEFRPGSRLLVDRWFTTLAPGEAVLYEGVDGEVQLGRIGRPPATASEETWAACEAGALWIVGDRPSLPARDSRVLGPLPPARVRGRVSFALPW